MWRTRRGAGLLRVGFLSVPIRVTTRPAFCGTVPKLGALSRIPQDVSCVLHFNYVFCIIIFFIPEIEIPK